MVRQEAMEGKPFLPIESVRADRGRSYGGPRSKVRVSLNVLNDFEALLLDVRIFFCQLTVEVPNNIMMIK